MTKTFAVAVGLAAAMAAAVGMAQSNGGFGWGPGMGPGCGAVQADCPGPGGGYGPGYGHGGGNGWGGGRGLALLTPDERSAFHDAMHAVKTLDECNAITAQHRQVLEQRAKEKGIAAPAGPRGNMCERMKARGFIS